MTKAPLRILAVSHVYPPEASGLSEAVAQISTRLASLGHRVEVATGALPGTSRRQDFHGVSVNRFDVRGNLVTGIHGEVREFGSFITSEPWDVIWINGAQIWATDIVLQSPSVRPEAVVLTLHGLPSRSDQSGRYTQYYRRLASAIPRLGALVAISHSSGEIAFCSEHQLPPPVVIFNGADIPQWSKRLGDVRERLGIRQAPWVVSVANHSPYKNHRLFFRAVASAQRFVPGTIGTIIGGHHAARKLRLGTLGIIGGCWYECSIRAKMVPGISLLAKGRRDEVIAAVQQADVFLMTSAWEGSSVALIEAMAAGTPWISTPVGSVREEKGGIVVSDEREMTQALHALLVDPTLRVKLGNQGHLHATQQHDWEVIAASYQQLFERVRAIPR